MMITVQMYMIHPSVHSLPHHYCKVNVISAVKEHFTVNAVLSVVSGSKVNCVRVLSAPLARVTSLKSHLSFPWRIIPHYSLLTPC